MGTMVAVAAIGWGAQSKDVVLAISDAGSMSTRVVLGLGSCRVQWRDARSGRSLRVTTDTPGNVQGPTITQGRENQRGIEPRPPGRVERSFRFRRRIHALRKQ